MTTENTPILLAMLETLDETAETWTEIKAATAKLDDTLDILIAQREQEAAG